MKDWSLYICLYPSFETPKIIADISYSSFINNRAGREGEVMYVTSNSNQIRVNLKENNFTLDNHEASKRGVISVNGSELNTIVTTIFNNNSADFGVFISACNSNVSVDNSTELYQYANPNFPQCMLFDSTKPIATTTSRSTSSSPTIQPTDTTKPGPDSTSAGFTVVWILAISTPVVCILVLLTVSLLGCLCLKCHRKSLAEDHCGTNYDYVHLINSSS